MNCQLLYLSLIERAKNRELRSPLERHRIIPKSLGGSNERENLVGLTPREHFVAHLLLARIHGGKMLQAFHFMASKNGTKVHSRLYEKARSVVVEEARKKGAALAKEKRGICGYRSRACGVGLHQKRTGHTGKVVVQ